MATTSKNYSYDINKLIVGKKSSENELLLTLIEKSGIQDIPKNSPDKKIAWTDIALTFNEATGLNHDHKSISKKWTNLKYFSKPEHSKNNTDEEMEYDANVIKSEMTELDYLPTNQLGAENLPSTTGAFDITKWEGMSENDYSNDSNLFDPVNTINNITLEDLGMQKMSPRDNKSQIELLKRLVRKSGIETLRRNSSTKIIVWKSIVRKFNEITGLDHDHKSLSKKWSNVKQNYLKTVSATGEVEYGDGTGEYSNSESMNEEFPTGRVTIILS